MERPVARSIIPLLFASMAIFVITVVIGILNGTDIWAVPHGILLAHVHAGTLGWITLSIFAGAAWIFGSDPIPKGLMYGSIASVVIYVAAFWADVAALRPIAGTFMLLMIFWFAGWIFVKSRGASLTVPRLSMLLGMVNLCIGGILGVLLGLYLAGVIHIPVGIAGAHPAMMVGGYLILAGVAMNEQLMRGPGIDNLPRSGLIQAIALFLGGIFLAVGLLLNVQPLLGLNLLLEVVGIVLAVVRNRAQIGGAGWATPSAARAGAISTLYLVPTLVVLGYLIIRYAKDFEAAPHGLIIALDHLTFIGVMTNAIFGLLLVAAAGGVSQRVEQLRFWGMNIGLVLFVIGLMAESPIFKRIGTPIMGLSILLGLAVMATTLREKPVPD